MKMALQVELIPAASAAERDQLLQAGQVDGVITDLVALALYNKEQTEVVAVRYAMVPTESICSISANRSRKQWDHHTNPFKRSYYWDITRYDYRVPDDPIIGDEKP